MSFNFVKFYQIQRSIFGVCPRSEQLFRLSDCRIYQRGRARLDWMDRIKASEEQIETLEENLKKREEKLREVARIKGRKVALRMVKQFDPVFTPRKLNPDDAKVLFHPIDYIVFKGMKTGSTRSVLLLDRVGFSKERTALQHSIQRVVEKERYEWLTIRIDNSGQVHEEN